MKNSIIILSLLILIALVFGCVKQIEKTDDITEIPKEQEQKTIEAEPTVAEEAASSENVSIAPAKVVEDPDTPSEIICKKVPLSAQLSQIDKYYCLAVVNDDSEICQQIKVDSGDEEDEANKNICFAVAGQDSSYCEKISDLSPKHVCYYQTAIISENINICDEIDYDQNEKMQCYFTFVSNLYWWDRSDEITTEYCNKFPAGQPDRNTCLAFKERDVSLCNNNVNCLTFFEQPMSFCNGKGSNLDDCVRDRAMSSKDVSICEQLSGEKRDDCLGDFCTHINLDIAICDKITEVMEKQSRYVEIAINIADEVRRDD